MEWDEIYEVLHVAVLLANMKGYFFAREEKGRGYSYRVQADEVDCLRGSRLRLPVKRVRPELRLCKEAVKGQA